MTELPDVLIAYGAAYFHVPSLPMPAPASVIPVCAGQGRGRRHQIDRACACDCGTDIDRGIHGIRSVLVVEHDHHGSVGTLYGICGEIGVAVGGRGRRRAGGRFPTRLKRTMP